MAAASMSANEKTPSVKSRKNAAFASSPPSGGAKQDQPLYLVTNGPVAELVLNRPDARNAMTRAMWRALPGLIGEVQNDKNIRVLMVHGGNTGAFCAGADIHELGQMQGRPGEALRFHDEMGAALATLSAFPGPVFARVHGPCIGAGLALALACDVRFAATTARFGVTPAKLGLTYPLADTARLVALIGPGRAKDLLFSARLIAAEEALRIGLIEHVVPDVDLLEFTDNTARRVSALSARTQRCMKAMINSLSAPDAEQARVDFSTLFGEPDFAEGLAAFAQKRKADFTGG